MATILFTSANISSGQVDNGVVMPISCESCWPMNCSTLNYLTDTDQGADMGDYMVSTLQYCGIHWSQKMVSTGICDKADYHGCDDTTPDSRVSHADKSDLWLTNLTGSQQ